LTIYPSAPKENSRRLTQTNTDISAERPARLKAVTATRRARNHKDLVMSNWTVWAGAGISNQEMPAGHVE